MPYVLGDGSDGSSRKVMSNPFEASKDYLLSFINILYLFLLTLLPTTVGRHLQALTAKSNPADSPRRLPAPCL